MLLDIAIGILGALLYADMANKSLTIILIATGVCFALLPDIDFVIHILRKKSSGRFVHQHRDLLHYPLLYLIGIFVLILPFGFGFAVFATSISFAHFLHDSIGLGWGIKWFFPFSDHSYKFFYDGKIVTSWTPGQLADQVAQHGDDHWLKNTYLRPSKTLLLELSVFLYAIFTMLMALNSW